MATLEAQVLEAVSDSRYKPLKLKSLAKSLNLPDTAVPAFRKLIKEMLKQGRLALGSNSTIKLPPTQPTIKGIFRRLPSGDGIVRPHAEEAIPAGDIYIHDYQSVDASTGDEVLVKLKKKPGRNSDGLGEILEIVERATQSFVGTYFERDGRAYVRVDGTVFSRSILVGDPGVKGAKPDDKVVIETLRFPTPQKRGEGVIVEILGKQGQPGVDMISVIKSLGIPDQFSEEALQEARRTAAAFREDDLDGRDDFTEELIITIDPVDAKDFDDAVSLHIDPKTKHWQLQVHIADVAHFVPIGGSLDRDARKRATSVYLPQRVIPMFPELISNGLASLQEGKVRYVKSALIDFTPAGQRAGVRFANGAIRVKKRFAYEQVSQILAEPEGDFARSIDPEIVAMLLRMKELALILRKRRFKRGALELELPEAVLEYDAEGHVAGAHFASHDISHQLIEEFMLAANEAVASHLSELQVPFLRRVHPAPNEEKLEAFGEFARHLGYSIKHPSSRFELQSVLNQSSDKPDRHAVHYALLRSLKQATYSPVQEEHFALASTDYCHFTSPIRRYPDLTVHRLLNQWLKKKEVKADENEMLALGAHCSRAERRAENAERELIKLRLLHYLGQRIGATMDAIITGVADYGFYAQGDHIPAEGLVHIRSLTDDFYHHDSATHTLEGRRTRMRYRLGDRVRVKIVNVDLTRRQLDLNVVATLARQPEPLVDRKKKSPKKLKEKKPKRKRK
jgi:ribonuclease R